jgi:hypothetical protein
MGEVMIPTSDNPGICATIVTLGCWGIMSQILSGNHETGKHHPDTMFMAFLRMRAERTWGHGGTRQIETRS